MSNKEKDNELKNYKSEDRLTRWFYVALGICSLIAFLFFYNDTYGTTYTKIEQGIAGALGVAICLGVIGSIVDAVFFQNDYRIVIVGTTLFVVGCAYVYFAYQYYPSFVGTWFREGSENILVLMFKILVIVNGSVIYFLIGFIPLMLFHKIKEKIR